MQYFGLRLYRLFHRARAVTNPVWPDRQAGRLVWLHAPSALAGQGIAGLVRRLHDEGLVDQVIVTCPEPFDCAGADVIPPPAERPEAVLEFLSHFAPDLGVWAGGQLRPVLLYGAGSRGIAMVLVDGTAPDLAGARFWPKLLPRLFLPFRRLLVRDRAAELAFVRAGAAPEKISVIGRLEGPSHVLPGNEPERAALSKLFGTRPLWLAVHLPEAEEAAIAYAHLLALRMAHRLLLIIVPEVPARAPLLAAQLQETYGLQVALRSQEQEPDEDVQVYIADTEGELGLWYRLAPIAWMGGTLAGPRALAHPFGAAALGSAILHGISTNPHAEAFDQLRLQGGSRLIPTTADLGEAVGDLLAPDRCARLAQKAWDVGSNGVEASDIALDLCAEILDEVAP